MNFERKGYQTFFTLGLLILMAANALATQPIIRWPVDCSITPMVEVTTGASIRFQFVYNSNDATKGRIADFRVKEVFNLTYSGPTSWKMDFGDRTSDTVEFEMTIPNHDTSGIIFEVTLGHLTLPVTRIFVSTADSIETFTRDVRKSNPQLLFYNNPDLDAARAAGSSERLGSSVHLAFPADTFTISNQGEMKIGTRPATADELKELKFREYERAPNLDSGRQYLNLDGQWYLREPGASKFQQILNPDPESPASGNLVVTDSLSVEPIEEKFQVVVIISDSATYEFAKKFSSKIRNSNGRGYFRISLTRNQIAKFKEKGISCREYDQPSQPPDSEDNIELDPRGDNDSSERSYGSQSVQQGSQAQSIYFEGFENGLCVGDLPVCPNVGA